MIFHAKIFSSVDAEWTANEEARQQDRAEPYTYYARYDAVVEFLKFKIFYEITK